MPAGRQRAPTQELVQTTKGQRDGEEAKSAGDNYSHDGEKQQFLSRVVVTLHELSDLHCRCCLECETWSTRHVANNGRTLCRNTVESHECVNGAKREEIASSTTKIVTKLIRQ